MNDNLGDETILSHYAENRKENNGAVVPPIYQNSLFTFENWEAINEAFGDRVNSFIYTRQNNPSVELVEEKIAKIANGEKAKLFGSGMAAISAALLHYLKPNDHVVAVKNIYGPANNLLNVYFREKMNIDTTFVNGEEIIAFKKAIKPNTKLIYLESPSSAIFSMQNIKAVTELAKLKNIFTIIDNTWATPVFQKPLELGVDLEIHSCSKYLGGHSDLVAGVIIGKAKDIDEIMVNEYELLGGKMAPFEAWLILRSLRTLPIRMKQHMSNAMKVAEYLENHNQIENVNYPGLKSHPQYELGKMQMSGYSGLLSFRLKTNNLEMIKKFFNSFYIFQIGVSWGGHESLIYAPAISYLKELPKDRFEELDLSIGDMRISVGLENPDDLINDLEHALCMIE